MCFRQDNKKPKFVRGWAIGEVRWRVAGGPRDSCPPVAYNIAMVFIETPIFTKRIQKAMDDDITATQLKQLRQAIESEGLK